MQRRGKARLVLRIEPGVGIEDVCLHRLRELELHRRARIVLEALQAHRVEGDDDVVHLSVRRHVGRAEDEGLSGGRTVEDGVQVGDRVLLAVVPDLEVQRLVRRLRDAELEARGRVRLDAAPASTEAAATVLLVAGERPLHQPALADVDVVAVRKPAREVDGEEALGVGDLRHNRSGHLRLLAGGSRELASRQVVRHRYAGEKRAVGVEAHLAPHKLKRHAELVL